MASILEKYLEIKSVANLKSAGKLLVGLEMYNQASRNKTVTENYFSYCSTKTYVVGTQKNRLDETVILRTQNTCLK